MQKKCITSIINYKWWRNFLENYLFELIKFYKEISQDSPIYLLTNGTLINDNLSQHLKELSINGIQVSLDGHTKDIHEFNRNSGAFTLTVEGIKNLVKNNIKFSVNCILNSRINFLLEDIFTFCKNLGVKELNFDRLLPVKPELKKYLLSANELKNKYYEILNFASKYNILTNTSGPLWCLIDKQLGSKDMTGLWGLTIDFNGMVYPASRLNIPIGNIFKDNLIEILINSETMKLLREHKIEICSDCEYFSKCRGNRILSYYYYGEFNKRDPQCWKRIETL